ncbi:hypothetical protein VULLAG_LOCUS16650 [Vulpes lagopus]
MYFRFLFFLQAETLARVELPTQRPSGSLHGECGVEKSASPGVREQRACSRSRAAPGLHRGCTGAAPGLGGGGQRRSAEVGGGRRRSAEVGGGREPGGAAQPGPQRPRPRPGAEAQRPARSARAQRIPPAGARGAGGAGAGGGGAGRGAGAGGSEDHAGRAAALVAVGLRRVVHLPHDLREQLVHRGFVFGRRLHEGAAPLLGQGLALAVRHLALALQVHLVAHQDHGHALVPLDADDLVPHGLDVLEALLVDQAVHEDEALAVLDVQVPHGRELLGARRVQDLQHRRRRVHLDLLAVEVLDGGVVLLDEGAGHELHGKKIEKKEKEKSTPPVRGTPTCSRGEPPQH